MKTAKRKPRKRVNRVKKLDQLFSLWIRDRDGCCRRCGTTNRCQAAHIVSRRYRAVRWLPENCITLCVGCHHWWHMNPLEAELWIISEIGGATFASIRQKALSMEKQDLDELIRKFS